MELVLEGVPGEGAAEILSANVPFTARKTDTFPIELTVRTWKWAGPQNKSSIPTIHFQVRTVSFRGCMSPKKGTISNRKYVFQPLIFRGHVSFRGSNSILGRRNRFLSFVSGRNLSLLGQLWFLNFDEHHVFLYLWTHSRKLYCYVGNPIFLNPTIPASCLLWSFHMFRHSQKRKLIFQNSTPCFVRWISPVFRDAVDSPCWGSEYPWSYRFELPHLRNPAETLHLQGYILVEGLVWHQQDEGFFWTATWKKYNLVLVDRWIFCV